MIRRLTSLVRQIVGRFIEMSKSEYYMMVAVMVLPVGLILFLEGEKVAGVGMVAVGILSWIVGLLTL